MLCIWPFQKTGVPSHPQSGQKLGSERVLMPPFLPNPSPHPQGKHEFVNDVASLWELSSEEEIHHFKNESLGMAFLHLCHLALCHGVPLEKVAKKIRCLGMGRDGSLGATRDLAYCRVFIQHLSGTCCGNSSSSGC